MHGAGYLVITPPRCDELQRRVLSMRHEALGATHEDTHRSAMDVCSRRPNPTRNPNYPYPLPLPLPLTLTRSTPAGANRSE
jgi:hypothetical protein